MGHAVPKRGCFLSQQKHKRSVMFLRDCTLLVLGSKSFSSARAVGFGNRLPKAVVGGLSLEVFKARLQKALGSRV